MSQLEQKEVVDLNVHRGGRSTGGNAANQPSLSMPVFLLVITSVLCYQYTKWNLKISNETQASHIFFFTLLVLLGNYEPTCIVTLKMLAM